MKGLIAALSGAAFLATWAATATAQSAAHKANVQAGLSYALHDCDACHVVAKNQPVPPLLQNTAPSFADIAQQPDQSAASLQTYLTKYHPRSNMPYPSLTPAQAADLAAYILSLRGRS